MTKRKILGITAAWFLLTGSAVASDDGKITFATEVNSCIAEVNDRADYNDATRVRHTVIEVKNTFTGYVLSIDTDVFTKSGEAAVRQYTSYCVAKGDGKPVRFRIERISG